MCFHLCDDGLVCQFSPALAADTFGFDADPVQVPGELRGDVGFPSCREAHHHDHGRGVGELGHRG